MELSEEEIENLIKKLNYCEEEYLNNGYLSVGKFKAIKEASELIEKQKKSNKEWYEIADNILRATGKYGEINIGEVANYIRERQKEIEALRGYISYAPNLDESTATKYMNIRREGYIDGRNEERQLSEQIIYEKYIPKSKIEDNIKENVLGKKFILLNEEEIKELLESEE